MYVHVIFFSKFHRTDLQHLGTKTGQFEHLVIRNFFNFACFLTDVGVSSVDTVNVGVDLTDISLERSSNGNGRGIGTAPTKRGYIAISINPLKTGQNNNGSLFKIRPDVCVADTLNACFRCSRIGNNRHLPSLIRFCLVPLRFEIHGKKPDSNLLSGCNQHVIFTPVGYLAHFIGKRDQFVGFA